MQSEFHTTHVYSTKLHLVPSLLFFKQNGYLCTPCMTDFDHGVSTSRKHICIYFINKRSPTTLCSGECLFKSPKHRICSSRCFCIPNSNVEGPPTLRFQAATDSWLRILHNTSLRLILTRSRQLSRSWERNTRIRKEQHGSTPYKGRQNKSAVS